MDHIYESPDIAKPYHYTMQPTPGLILKIKSTGGYLQPPRFGDTGFDLSSADPLPIILKAKNYITVPTGICVELPKGYDAQVRPRSGLASRGIMASLGTIDNSYRGEIKVVLFNFSDSDFIINLGDRIAQLVISRVYIPETVEQEAPLSVTERGDRGFGSTGI